jgi:transcriptional regulator with XRE-family HTH domain
VDNIGSKISSIRKSKGISQRKLAQKANLSQSFISHLENGCRNPTINSLQKISNGLNIPLNEFLLFIIGDIDNITQNN